MTLKNYDKSRTLDPTQWHDNITHRALLDSLLKHNIVNEHTLESLKAHNQQNIIDGFLTKDFGEINAEFDLYGEFFYSMTNPMLEELENIFLMDRPTHDDLNEHRRLKHMSRALAVIDLDAPDEMLLRSFQEWLKKIRQNRTGQAKKKRITESILRRWQTNRVIEYIDLSQWFKLRNESLLDHQAAAILFPHDSTRNTTEVVTKTIRKKAVPEILAIKTRQALISQGLEFDWKGNI
ncbi:MAG: DUF6387 family protein [Methylophaga sp.]